MCATTQKSRMSNTFQFAHFINRLQMMVWGYGNTAQNLSGLANCMITCWPINGKVRYQDMLDTSSMPHLMNDFQQAIAPPAALGSRAQAPKSTFDVHAIGIYHHVWLYPGFTIGEMDQAFSRVPAEKRPRIDQSWYQFIAKYYPGFSLLVSCFNNTQPGKEMIIFRARPDFKLLSATFSTPVAYICTVDAHNGEPPNMHANVAMDHQIAVGTNDPQGNRRWRPVTYTDLVPPDWQKFLPTYLIGREYQNIQLPNGDFVVPLASIDAGQPDFVRHTPPPHRFDNR